MRRSLLFAPLVLLAAGLIAFFPARRTAAAQPLVMEPGAAALVERVGEHLKKKEFAEISALGERPDAFSFLSHGARGRTAGWNAAPLLLPEWGGGATPVIDFYGFHTLESIGDHFFRLAHRAEGWRIGAEIPLTETLGYRVRDHQLA